MQPTTAVNRLDLGMTQVEFDLKMNQKKYIGNQVLPIVVREKPEGSYPRIKLEHLLQTRDTKRAPGGEYPRSEGEWEQDNYTTEEHGHEATLDDRTVKKYGDIIDAEYWETERIIDIVLRQYEIAVADLLFNATTFAGRTAGVSNEWDDHANATPIDDIETNREAIALSSGLEPNALVINSFVARNLMSCAQIIDRLKQQDFQDARLGAITAEMLAISLDIDHVIVAGGITNTANPALARAVSRIWSNEYALLCHVPEDTTNPASPGLGRTVVWGEEGGVDGEQLAILVEEYREEKRRGSTLRARCDRGLKLQYVEAGYLLSNITT